MKQENNAIQNETRQMFQKIKEPKNYWVSASIASGAVCMLEEYEKIDNIKLIRNNLRHINFELVSNKPSPMRIAKECHQLLLRMMVEALRGTANLAITGRPTKDRKYWYRGRPNDSWKVIQKENIEGCSKAWRYSEPVLESPPGFPERENSDLPLPDNYLLGFYDLLAMIQAPCFMLRYSHSTVVSVSNTEMQLLEWLHEEIRNDFEHFIPKILLACSDDCLRASEICLRLTIDLLTKSNNVISDGVDDLQTELCSTLAFITNLQASLNDV